MRRTKPDQTREVDVYRRRARLVVGVGARAPRLQADAVAGGELGALSELLAALDVGHAAAVAISDRVERGNTDLTYGAVSVDRYRVAIGLRRLFGGSLCSPRRWSRRRRRDPLPSWI